MKEQCRALKESLKKEITNSEDDRAKAEQDRKELEKQLREAADKATSEAEARATRAESALRAAEAEIHALKEKVEEPEVSHYTSPSHSLSRSPSKTPKIEAPKPFSNRDPNAKEQNNSDGPATLKGNGTSSPEFGLAENIGLVRLKRELQHKMEQADLATQRLTARRGSAAE